jgi:dienelactone hydrolase
MEPDAKIYREQINGPLFYGTLFYPQSETGSLHAIVILPGSSGSIPDAMAQHIASYGYLVLALRYFGSEGLPKYLEGISLKYFTDAITWLRGEAVVKAFSITLLGYSRGGELSLLLGSMFPTLVDGIIAYVPSSNVCGGFPHPNRPTWLHHNKPTTPFLKGLSNDDPTLTEADDLRLATEEKKIEFHQNTETDPYLVVDLFLARQQNQKDAPYTAIQVENIRCPLLVVSGQDDKIWPSSLYAKQIAERLNENESTIVRKFLDFPNAGHGIIAPYDKPIYHPVGHFWCVLGGTPEGNQLAYEKAWQETFAFLELIKTTVEVTYLAPVPTK